MAEYIERENLIDYLTRPTGQKATCDGCCDIDCVDCIRDEVIKNLPTADVVEVVRCKDCRHFRRYTHKNRGECGLFGELNNSVQTTDYCSYGERRCEE